MLIGQGGCPHPRQTGPDLLFFPPISSRSCLGSLHTKEVLWRVGDGAKGNRAGLGWGRRGSGGLSLHLCGAREGQGGSVARLGGRGFGERELGQGKQNQAAMVGRAWHSQGRRRSKGTGQGQWWPIPVHTGPAPHDVSGHSMTPHAGSCHPAICGTPQIWNGSSIKCCGSPAAKFPDLWGAFWAG